MNPFTKVKQRLGSVSPTESTMAMLYALLSVAEAHYEADSGILTATGNHAKDVAAYVESLVGSDAPAVVYMKQRLSV